MMKQFTVVAINALLVFLFLRSEAQFNNALLPVYGAGLTPVQATITGNDIHDIGGVIYEVSVSDDPNGNNSAIIWRSGTNTGVIQIGQGSGVINPDVCLVKNNANRPYILVVYYEPASSEYRLEVYQWIFPQQTFLLESQYPLAQGVAGNTLQIASDDNGAFAIVWDEQGGPVKFAYGSTTGSLAPELYQGGQLYDLEPGLHPDVCVFRSQINGDRQVHVVYVNAGGALSADTYAWDDLSNGIINPSILFRSPPPDLQYQYPKIACPGSSYGKKEDFTIVVEDTDINSTWMIKGFNNNFSSSALVEQHIYNNGSTGNSPWNLTTVPNTRPVAAYDHVGDGVWVGWNVDNMWGLLNAPGAAIGKFPVIISGTKRAGVNPGANYLYASNVMSFGSYAGELSMAGQKSTHLMVTYNDENIMEVVSKILPHQYNVSNLKESNPSGNFHSWLSHLQSVPDLSKKQLQISIFDISGRLISFEKLPVSENIDPDLQLKSKHLSGVFLIRASVPDSEFHYTGRITILR